jgi:uncharacterized protein
VGNLENVQAVFEAFSRGDVPAILQALADDVEWDQDAPGYGSRSTNPSSARNTWLASLTPFRRGSSSSGSNRGTSSAGGTRSSCHQHRTMVKSNGNALEAPEIHLWTFGDDGKVSRFFRCIDRHAVLLAYGL